MRIIFAGTPDFAASSLRALLDSEHEIVAVYTQPDRPKGRGRKLAPSPVKELALSSDLPVHQPVSLKNEDEQNILKDHNADLMVVVAYGLLLPQAVLDIPKLGCVNVHASLLPRWRGAAPIERAITEGDPVTGVTIMQMDEGLDTGAMLLKAELPITAEDTGASMHQKLADIGATTLLACLTLMAEGNLHPEEQDSDLATYAAKLSKEEGRIDWHNSGEKIDRLIRGFNPRPVAYTELEQFEGKPIRLWQARVLEQTSDVTPGTIISADKKGIQVATQTLDILLEQLQMQGGKVLTAQQLLNSKAELFQAGKRFT